MKKVFYIFIILLLASCKNSLKNNEHKKLVITDTVATGEIPQTRYDAVKKVSKPFTVNDIQCYWELNLSILEGNNADPEGQLMLKNKQSNKTLLIHTDYYSLKYGPYEFNFNNSFDSIDFESLNLEGIKDANFDGYKDFIIYDKHSSGSAGMFYRVYLFNNREKIFEKSNELSGYDITIDTINRAISLGGRSGYSYNTNATIYFGKKGKIKFKEFTEREVIEVDSTRLLKTSYRKVIDKKTIKTKIDTTNFEGW